MKNLLNNAALGIMTGLILAACGGGSDQTPASSSQALLADGEACNAAWSATAPYNGGNAVSYGGRNYTAAYWTQNNNPSTSSGAAGSGQPWITGYLCGGGATTTTAAGTTTTKAATTTTTAAATTTTVSSCNYPNWSAGVNYSLGTIVKYAANGNYYKEVQAGTNGSDGTDPTISTWYWSQYTCTGGGGTTTTTVGSGGFVVSEAQFNSWFPNRNSFYTYSDLLAAMAYYPTFAKSGNATVDKQEAAAFFANLQHESDSLKAVREYNTNNYPLYCDVNWVQVACRSSNWNDEYFGRGPIQISWTTNYRNLSSAMGLGTQLVDNPELLATNATIAWRSALWYWMTQVGPNTITPHTAITGGSGFGQTIKSINGARECVGGSAYTAEGHTQMQVRVNNYTTFTGNLGVATGGNLTC